MIVSLDISSLMAMITALISMNVKKRLESVQKEIVLILTGLMNAA